MSNESKTFRAKSPAELDPLKVGIAVTCTVCGHRKQPVGRSAPLGSHLCDWECPGYRAEPSPGSLWPGESEADFGFPVGDVGTKRKEGAVR